MSASKFDGRRRYGPFAAGDVVTESGTYFGIVSRAGAKMFEVLWSNGCSSRHAQTYQVIWHVDPVEWNGDIAYVDGTERAWVERHCAEVRKLLAKRRAERVQLRAGARARRRAE